MRTPRHNLDQYETADWQVDALVDHLPELSGSIWCPTVGDGALAKRLLYQIPDLRLTLVNDIDPANSLPMLSPVSCHLDATKMESWNDFGKYSPRPDWIVDNPPFNAAIDILQHAYTRAKRGVAFLLRISFTEPTKDRAAWLAKHPLASQITMERYSFTGNGKSDNVTAAWMVWVKPEVDLIMKGGYVAMGYRPVGKRRRRVTITQ